MTTKSIQIFLSALFGISICLLFWVATQLFSGTPGIVRFFELLGGNLPSFIHIFIYASFMYGLLELLNNHKYIRGQYGGFNLNLLPMEDQRVITPEEVAKIKLNAIDLEKRGFHYLVAEFIKKACTQYRNDKSISDTLQVFEAQVDNNKGELEGNLEMVRYTINAIVSLGFIGTLIGLSSAIGLAHLAKTEEGMPEITSQLNMAFDTTLVALLTGLVLNFLYHRYLEDLDTFYSRTKSYIIDNLISRIYVGHI
ncbi:MAG: MotA/TolQ/ExbB proton channel family protein [Saprospiraceae bacterium]